MTSYYSEGSVTLVAGSKTVVGNGTIWQTALIAGGNIIVEAPGNIMPIAAVVSDSSITSELAWTGASGTYSYVIQRDTAYLKTLDVNSQNVAFLLSEIRQGTIFKYDVSGPAGDRAIYDARAKGFSYLATDGGSLSLYVKRSATPGDWAGPFAYGRGETGPPPSLGIGTVTTRNPDQSATAGVTGANGNYLLNLGLPRGVQGFKGWAIEPEIVHFGERTVLRVSDFIGGEGTKPAGAGLYVGATGLVSDVDDAVNIRGLQGPQGLRGVLWRGAWSAATGYSVGDLVTDVDVGGNPATFIALVANTNSEPISNPNNWGYFPASVPMTVNYGSWGDAVTSNINYGSWA
jgi:hypothetical protein